MRFPTIDDFMLFSAWDGYMIALYCVVFAALTRFMGKFLKVDPTSSNGTKVRLICNAAWTAAFAVGIASYLWLPSRGIGVWGVIIIVLIVITYVNVGYGIRKGKSLF